MEIDTNILMQIESKIYDYYKEICKNMTTSEKRLFFYSRIINYCDTNIFDNNNFISVLTEKEIDIISKEIIPYKGILARICLKHPIIEILRDKNYYFYCKEDDLDIEYESYNRILTTYKDASMELNINSSLELSYYLSYLLWNGYLSYNKEHIYDQTDRTILFKIEAIDIFRGRGVCREYAYLLEDFLNICNKKNTLLKCIINSNKIKRVCK